MTVEVNLWPQASQDFRQLPLDVLRWEALRYITRLRTEPYLGTPLRDHPLLGDLSDCRKIYLDERHDVDPRWRIVYRLLPNDGAPRFAEVIVIGAREGAAVYHEAMKRLARQVGAEQGKDGGTDA